LPKAADRIITPKAGLLIVLNQGSQVYVASPPGHRRRRYQRRGQGHRDKAPVRTCRCNQAEGERWQKKMKDRDAQHMPCPVAVQAGWIEEAPCIAAGHDQAE
jgi:hypothetical protein